MSRSFEFVYFPPIESADESGLLMLGGKLTPPWLVQAYCEGIFPWPMPELTDLIPWFCPDPRAVFELGEFYVSSRLRRRILARPYRVTCDADFAGVIAACAEPREDERGTWITEAIQAAYTELHRLGLVHSVEVWEGETLVGGLYGLALGRMFAAESMFFRRRDASKIALAYLVEHLKARRFALFDIQQLTSHTASLGAREISRDEYLDRLAKAIRPDDIFRADLFIPENYTERFR